MNIITKICRICRGNKPYYPRDQYYKNLLNKYKDLEPYLSLTNLHNKKALLTDRNIGFSDSQLFKKNERKYFKKKYGKPNYVIVNKYSFGKITIWFYRVNIASQEANMELHFFQNSLFMYNYIFPYLKKNSDKNNLLNVIKKKYRIDKEINKIPNYYIMDKKKSVINIFESFGFKINYVLNTNSNLFHKMNDDFKVAIERDKQIKNQYKQELYEKL